MLKFVLFSSFDRHDSAFKVFLLRSEVVGHSGVQEASHQPDKCICLLKVRNFYGGRTKDWAGY